MIKRVILLSTILLTTLILAPGCSGVTNGISDELNPPLDPFDGVAVCVSVDNRVQCQLSPNIDMFEVGSGDPDRDILLIAQGVDSSITINTVMWVQAWGGGGGGCGAGGSGDTHSGSDGAGGGGAGSLAMVPTGMDGNAPQSMDDVSLNAGSGKIILTFDPGPS